MPQKNQTTEVDIIEDMEASEHEDPPLPHDPTDE